MKTRQVGDVVWFLDWWKGNIARRATVIEVEGMFLHLEISEGKTARWAKHVWSTKRGAEFVGAAQDVEYLALTIAQAKREARKWERTAAKDTRARKRALAKRDALAAWSEEEP